MSSGLQSLATIIKRLEAATSRIEDLADAADRGDVSVTRRERDENETDSTYPSPHPPSGLPPSGMVAPPPPPPPPAAVAAPEVPRSVVAFEDGVLKGRVRPFVELTKSFAGASVIEIASLVEKQYNELRTFLHLAASCQKPDQSTIEALLGPLQASIEAISRAKEANRREREWYTHLTILGEGAPSIGWVISIKPGPYVSDIKDSVDYYGNKLIKEFKDQNPKHVEWVRSFVSILEEMRKYVMEFHTTGLSWNPKGLTVDKYKSASSAASPPPPPPPPPVPAAPSVPKAGGAPAGGAAAVFAELNRGEEVTKGLRKVDRSEMTHKNPSLRAGGTVPPGNANGASLGKKPIKPSKPQALAGKKPAKFVLDGTKWLVEYQENESSLMVDNVEINHTVNLYGCKNTTVVIKGKVNAVTIVNCHKTSVLIPSVVSSVSVTASPSFTIQITGSAPMIQVDSTDGGQIYLAKTALNAEITTAKCSAINVSLPVEGEEDGVFEEAAVPEMLRSLIKDGKLVTSVVEHVG